MNFILFLALPALSSSFMVYCSLIIGLLELISWKGKPESKADRWQRGAVHTQQAKEMEGRTLWATAEGQDGNCQHTMDFVEVSSWSTQTFSQPAMECKCG